MEVRQLANVFGLRNEGFDAIAVQAGRAYHFSLHGRHLFTGN
ncbi:MAG: hypothetical protein RMN51_01300 [Verrucomicrobiota bacterium]|nr:hypothetical protein [Limisphaera sp.]MDW8380734.1 hypothetical protein [Verrucomicrobiota bacterium]